VHLGLQSRTSGRDYEAFVHIRHSKRFSLRKDLTPEMAHKPFWLKSSRSATRKNLQRRSEFVVDEQLLRRQCVESLRQHP
jgi:hypothetical protein